MKKFLNKIVDSVSTIYKRNLNSVCDKIANVASFILDMKKDGSDKTTLTNVLILIGVAIAVPVFPVMFITDIVWTSCKFMLETVKGKRV